MSVRTDPSAMQMRFCEILVSQPIGDRNYRRAAIEAGASPTSASTLASKWLKLAKVKAYLASISRQAEAIVEVRRGKAVSDLAESLEFLTTVQRARLGDYLTDRGEVDVERLRQAPAGLVRRFGRKVSRRVQGAASRDAEQIEDEHIQFELESAQSAAKTLVEYHTGAKVQPPQQRTVNVLAVLGNLPVETLRQIKDAFAGADERP